MRRYLALALLLAAACTSEDPASSTAAWYDVAALPLGAAEYGPANWVASPNYTNASRKVGSVKVIVVHTVQGSYSGCISWFQNPNAKVSAHYVVSKTGAVTQMVKEEDIGWHVGSENGYTIGIEHEGYVTDPNYVTPQMLQASADLTCYLLKKWQLSADKVHVKGHVELPNQTHTDPGKYWPWSDYLAKINACMNPGPPPVAGCCGTKVPEGGQTVIDDVGNDCIQKFGPSDSWWTGTKSGYGGSVTYTYTSSKSFAENWARWRLTFAKAGKYKIEAWIPANHASAKPTYEIKHAGVVSKVTVDQKPLSNVWVDLGTHDFAANCDEYVAVADNTGQAYDVNITLGVDAVRATAVGTAPPPTCPGGCDDKNVCTDDTCVNGQCVFANNTATCWDQDACTAGEKCSGGKCVGGQIVKDCSDGNPCTADGCTAGNCTHTPAGGGCDDGNGCTTGDSCQNGQCVGGGATNCDDGNPCTADACQGGQCTHTGKNCDDGVACTKDTCVAGGCDHSPDSGACDDKNPCTKDTCANGCVSAPTTGACEDGNPCTIGEICQGGTCAGGGPKPCLDDNPCTTDACVAGTCVFAPLEGTCDDGDACSTGDYCAKGLCLGGAVKDCDDGLACTTDACQDGQCVHQGKTVPATKVCQGNAVSETDGCGDTHVTPCPDGSTCQDGECQGAIPDAGSDGQAAGNSDAKTSPDGDRGDSVALQDGKVQDSSGLGLDVSSGGGDVASGGGSSPDSGCTSGPVGRWGGVGLVLLALTLVLRRRRAS